MTTPSPSEQLVEDVAAVYFGAIGASINRGIEVDDAGERRAASEVTLRIRPWCDRRGSASWVSASGAKTLTSTVSQPS